MLKKLFRNGPNSNFDVQISLFMFPYVSRVQNSLKFAYYKDRFTIWRVADTNRCHYVRYRYVFNGYLLQCCHRTSNTISISIYIYLLEIGGDLPVPVWIISSVFGIACIMVSVALHIIIADRTFTPFELVPKVSGCQ
jgi:hypothetical protein